MMWCNLPSEPISTTCDVSLSKNDMKCISMFPLNHSDLIIPHNITLLSHHWFWQFLPNGTKPFPKPNVVTCQFYTLEQTSMIFQWKYKIFIQENFSENDVYIVCALLFRHQYVNGKYCQNDAVYSCILCKINICYCYGSLGIHLEKFNSGCCRLWNWL